MALNVAKKGQTLSITKNGQNVKQVIVEVTWNGGSNKMDFDLSTVALMDKDGFPFGKGVDEQHVCFFNQQETPAMKSSGDDKGAEDDDAGEEIVIDFTKLPSRATHVHAILTIYHADNRGHRFSDLKSATLTVKDAVSGEAMIKTDVTEFDKSATSMLFAEFRRVNGDEFSFTAVNQTYAKEIGDFFSAYDFATEE